MRNGRPGDLCFNSSAVIFPTFVRERRLFFGREERAVLIHEGHAQNFSVRMMSEPYSEVLLGVKLVLTEVLGGQPPFRENLLIFSATISNCRTC